MNYLISHQIRYKYSSPVFLEPHIVRLRPRTDPCQQISSFMLSVDPQPVEIHQFLDTEGNNTAGLWFEEMTDSLTISTSFSVRTFCANPFSYLVTDQDFLHLPANYPADEIFSLTPCLTPGAQDNGLTALCKSILTEVDGNSLSFLNRLCSVIYEKFTVEIRNTGPTLPASVTLAKKSGACRDLAMLFMEACRNVGLAARFVSGYQEGDADMEKRHLHAWTEVYIPGGGWRGYDPTHGLAVADRHIAVAASHHPKGATPVTGTFRGTGVTADMDFQISLGGTPTQ